MESTIFNAAAARFGLPAFASRLLAFDAAERLYASARGETLCENVLRRLRIECRTEGRDLERIPRRGPALVVANHPFGMLEGAVLAAVLRQVRGDVRFLANSLLAGIPELRALVIPVDPLDAGSALNRTGLRTAVEHLRGGGLLAVFPAGEVSHFHLAEGRVTDGPWNPAIARLLSIAARGGTPAAAVPVFISGRNSLLFQLAGMAHPRLHTALLARELLNKTGRAVAVRIGSPVEGSKLLAMRGDEERIQYLRWRTYLLEKRERYQPRTRLPLLPRRRHLQEPVAPAVGADVMREEVAALPPECLLDSSGNLRVYVARAARIPHVLREIGRLREIAFRAVGEGTGKSLDLDRFDEEYLHLFLWNEPAGEVAGAYRLAATDVAPALYTASLFSYGDAFLRRMGPALELGRSFVRVEYQRGFAPLLLLWKGIGRFVARNPRYKVLFGPVSISSRYQSISRELIVSFLERKAPLREWMGLVKNRNPLRRRAAVPNAVPDLEDLSAAIADIEPDGAGVPVLLRQYLKLGGRLIGFNVDPEFSGALDGLIVVDLTRTEPKLLERYLGKSEAARFLAFQKGTYGTH